MEIKGFLDIAQNILQENTIAVQVAGGSVFSFPVLAKRQNRILDAMFTFQPAASGSILAPRPHGWLMIDSKSGKIAQLGDCDVVDFVDQSRYPIESQVSLELPKQLGEQQYANAYRQIYETYEELRAFAFKENPSEKQLDIMAKYSELFSLIAPVGHYPFYSGISPEFFKWVRLDEIVGQSADNNTAPMAEPVLVEIDQRAEIASLHRKISHMRDELITAIGEAVGNSARIAIPSIGDGSGQNHMLSSMYDEMMRYKEGVYTSIPDNIEKVSAEMKALREELALVIGDEANKAQLLTAMHDELTQYKNGLLDTIVASWENDIIKTIDDIEKSVKAYRKRSFTRDNFRRLVTLLEGFGTDLCDILYRQGVEPFEVIGDDVDIRRQRILEVKDCQDMALDKKVAARHSRGWEKKGKVVRPERITIYSYAPPSPPEESSGQVE